MLEWARAALDEPTARTLRQPPQLLRSRLLDTGGRVLTYRVAYSSAELALSRERAERANAVVCEAIAESAGLRWTLGYPVQRTIEPRQECHVSAAAET